MGPVKVYAKSSPFAVREFELFVNSRGESSIWQRKQCLTAESHKRNRP